ncbi:MAG: hypothetical protein AAFU03_16195, partial [Bacteroidota bacterium]
MKRIILICWLATLLVLPILTQQQDSLPANPPPALNAQVQPPAPSNGNIEDIPVNAPVYNESVNPPMTTTELYLSVGVLVFGALITLGLLYLLAVRTRGGSSAELMDSMKYPIVVVIIVGGVFLVTAGYGNEQIAPIIGLMGTIAGYLMGR